MLMTATTTNMSTCGNNHKHSQCHTLEGVVCERFIVALGAEAKEACEDGTEAPAVAPGRG